MSVLNSLNSFDLILIVFTLISILYGYFRGLIKEVFSITTLILSCLFSFYFFSDISTLLKKYISVTLLADSLSFGITFIVVFSIFSFISSFLTKHIKSSSLRIFDKNLGIIFGGLRAFVLVSILYIFTNWTLWTSNPPDWVTNSKSFPIIDNGAKLILNLTPENTLDQVRKIINYKDINFNKNIKENHEVRKISEPPLNSNKKNSSEGYKKNDNDALDKLINMEDTE